MITPCADAMVIMVVIKIFRIERVLVDDGSSVNFLHFYMFKKMGLDAECLILVKSHLKEIYNFPIPIDGRIILLVTVGEEDEKGIVSRGKP